jgi:hypothetical protein
MDQNQVAYDAARDGDLRGVEVALAQGADVNAHIDGDTMLMISVEERHYDVARFLLEHGANPNLADVDDDFTPLYLARSARVIDLLVAHGADVDHQNIIGYAALHDKVGDANIESVRAMLRHGASFSIRNNRDQTALALAQRLAGMSGMEPIINLLQAVEAAGSYKRYLREPVVQLLALRYLSLAGRATAPANLLRLFGAPPVRNAGKARTRARRAASTPLPEEVFKLVLGFWNERVR